MTEYEIVVQGHVAERAAHWFDGLTATLRPDGTTLLTGPMVDQTALHALLARTRDLNMPLLLVRKLPAGAKE